MSKRTTIILVAIVGAIAAAAVAGSMRSEVPAGSLAVGGGPTVQVVIPAAFSDTAKTGEQVFNATCAACHGENAAGTEVGPPLVHRIYEPSHHADFAFDMAINNGVRAHHWKFGNMPPQPGLTKADVATLIAYVRELQRANGIE